MKRGDGGAAFPQQGCDDAGLPNGGSYTTEAGLTVRDYFAIRALQGMLSSDSSVDRTKINRAAWAAVSYSFADAMLAERGKP